MRKILLIIFTLTPFLLLGQSGFDTPGDLPNLEDHRPFILYNNQAELDSIIARIGENGGSGREPYLSWKTEIYNDANNFLSDNYSTLDRDYCGEAAATMAFRWKTENSASTAYRDSAKSALLQDVSPTNIFDNREGVIFKCISLDLMWDDLTSSEKNNAMDLIKDWCIDVKILNSQGCYNRNQMRAEATMLGAFSYEPRDSSTAQTRLDNALTKLDSSFSYYTDSTGVWHEGSGYTDLGNFWIPLVQNAYYNATGRNFIDDTYYALFSDWWIWSRSASTLRYWMFDDSYGGARSNHGVFVNETLFGSSRAKKAKGRFSNFGFDSQDYSNFHTELEQLALHKDSVTIDTSLNPSKEFPNAGIVVSQDYWSGSGYELCFTAETFNFNTNGLHEQFEGIQISTIYWNGTIVMTEPGYGANSSEYGSLYNNWSVHNVFDGNENDGGQLYNANGIDYSYMNDYADYAEGNGVHYNHNWKRAFLLWKTKFIAVFDWIDDTDSDNQYKYYWSMPGRNSWSEDQSNKYVYNDTMGVKINIYMNLQSMNYINQHDAEYEFDYNDFLKSTRQEFKGSSSSQEDSRVVWFIQARNSSGGTDISVIEGTDASKAWVNNDTMRVILQYSTNVVDEMNLKTNGRLGVVADSAGTTQFWTIRNADSLIFDNNYLFEANTEIDGIILEATDNTRNGYVQNSSGSYDISLYLASEPDNIKVGGSTESYTWDGNKATFTVDNSGEQALQVNMTGEVTPSVERRRAIIIH